MRRLLSALLAGAALWPASAGATTVRALTTSALVAEAEVIAIGECVDLTTAWEGRTLVTRATIQVGESLKGDVAGLIVVTVPGGIDLNRRIPIAMTYPGAPVLRPGEQVFLFLDRAGDGSALTVAGFSQGKYSIGVDGSGQSYVTRDLTDLTLVTPTAQSPGTRSRISLAEFRREVRGHLAR